MTSHVGVDVLRVGELAALLERGWFMSVTYTPAEQADAYALTGGRRQEYLTGRFAAKEAVSKLLGSGLFGSVKPRDIETRRGQSGRPQAVLSAGARRWADRLGIGAINLSIAHKESLVVAVAVADGLPDYEEPDSTMADAIVDQITTGAGRTTVIACGLGGAGSCHRI